ncbi:MAG: hypothetical protein WC623_23970 [Pedobacter sp.]|uniref:hypothetical protein n=1 Tax=Pedobacter sp. TaxID=1411316 RepID=UPI003564DBA8
MKIPFGMILDPNKIEFSSGGVYTMAKYKINGKKWKKSHIVYAFYNQITLIELQKILNSSLIVHHINGRKKDDSVGTLQLMVNEEHSALHAKGLPMIRHKKNRQISIRCISDMESDDIVYFLQKQMAIEEIGWKLLTPMKALKEWVRNTG